MKNQRLTVQFNNKISGGVYHMSLAGNCSEISRPGQFIDILIDDFFLRRPISIFDHDDAHVEILYRAVGAGTDALASKSPGDVLDVLLPLGNGFDVDRCGKQNLLVAGGIGMPPIHELARLMTSDFRVLLGFRSAEDMFGIDAFRSLGIEPVVATEDGSFGIKGLVTDVMDMMKSGELDFDYDYVFCCGPEPMLKAVYEHSPDGQFSFEERMGCGFGACMGCSCKTKYGYKRICKDGPILFKDEIIW
jgi:dihydroorotate dehydrogenase electron transfer subunit